MNKDIVFIEHSGKRYRLQETDRYSCKECAFAEKRKDCPRLKSEELICDGAWDADVIWVEDKEVEK